MPTVIKATGTLQKSGVDDTTSVSLEFPNGVIGNAIISGTVNLKQSARIFGTNGTIEVSN